MHELACMPKSALHRTGLVLGIAVMALAASAAAQGQAQVSPVLKQAVGFINTGGYFLTDSGSNSAFGSPKFYNQGAYYARPKHFGNITLTGGVETVTVSDHILPFSGGNEYDLLGPGFRISTTRYVGHIQPFFSGGAFYGRLRSVNRGFDRSAFTPSMSFGIEYPISRDFTLSASYRLSQHINGVNTDGFGVSLRIF